MCGTGRWKKLINSIFKPCPKTIFYDAYKSDSAETRLIYSDEVDARIINKFVNWRWKNHKNHNLTRQLEVEDSGREGKVGLRIRKKCINSYFTLISGDQNHCLIL